MILLPFVVWTQSALGHMPFPVTTAVHVPMGAGLLTYVVVLALTARPSAGTRSRAGQGGAAGPVK